MFTAELYKTRNHHMPWVLAALGSIVLAIPSVYYFFRPPTDVGAYAETVLLTYSLLSVLIGAVFGGWVVGHEYRQSTMRRVIALDARRGRLLVAKAAVGLLTLAVVLAAMLATGLGLAAITAAIGEGTYSVDGLLRTIAAATVPAFIAAAVAFALSVIVRSDTYATLASVALLLIFGPLLGALPTVGDYMLAGAADDLALLVDGEEIARSTTRTVAIVAGWLGALGLGAQQALTRRDI